ncbi:hypothetical protein QNI19_24645 [Cytophagaceae bacterium DM2B3-1]|uniref:DUF6892 domain-containing protein n=1 Tax=Xanthocytophaga flava TaxID=3048013 RepID=A0ABT7CU40_9BACT|nr:hypothetical protein [Xanthocytophaga flavus]MDJ1496149.1 hypothetical protein [Xanthocytophaga flavus]
MFTDRNLQLVIVDESISLGEQYGFGWDKDFDQFCQQNFGKLIELNYEVNRDILQFFLSLQIPKKDLEAIKYLCLDGDHATYSYLSLDIKPQLDELEIHSLEGIENCKNLNKLSLGAMASKIDLQPLTQLTKLEKLSIDFYTATHYQALLHIPSLKKVEVYNWQSFTPEDKKELADVLQQLESHCELLVSPDWKNTIR